MIKLINLTSFNLPNLKLKLIYSLISIIQNSYNTNNYNFVI